MIRHILEQGILEMGLMVVEKDIRAYESFADELKKWNRKLNLTAITDDTDVAVKHILDSLFLAYYVNDGERILDIGSGAGIPAIPLKIARPKVTVVSVDAVAKKINFQRHVCRLLALHDFEALHSRVEDLQKKPIERFDVITSRAFSSLEHFVTLAKPLLVDGGRIIAMKGPASDNEVEMASEALDQMGFKISAVNPYNLPFNAGKRRIIVLSSGQALLNGCLR